MQKNIIMLLLSVGLLGSLSVVKAQQNDGMIVIEEILIKVEPELPTVIVTIPRQDPNVKPIALSGPYSRMVNQSTSTSPVELKSTDVAKVVEPSKIVAEFQKD